MTLKPWRDIAVPHEDVRRGDFSQAEFAADLTRVRAGTAAPEYQDAAQFFRRTYITEGMRLLLDSVIRRLSGKGGDPVIQLQTAFGGGKTHTMLAVLHIASSTLPARDLAGVPRILDAAQVTELPAARVVVLDGNALSPNQPKQRDGIAVNTIWGELAWQLGGAPAYEQVRGSDEAGTSPGKEVLAALLAAHAPCVILVDELVRYVAQFEEGRVLTGGSFDSNLSFIQALTEALKAVPNALMLASLPESVREAGSQRGVKALESLSHYFGRVQALWKPVATEEAFEIVRRRLFDDVQDKVGAERVCRAFTEFYAANSSDFPSETQEGRYLQRMLQAYPIHPEVFDRLYEDWSSLDNFQRTRGVLKLMAKVIHRLWMSENNDPLVMPGSLPLSDNDVRTEAIYYLPQGWDPVIEGDIDGDRAETTEIEKLEPLLGSLQACRRAARTIFLGSAPTTAEQSNRGIAIERVLLGAAQPGQPPGRIKDAVARLTDRLHYLNTNNNRYWFDTRPNLRREMEDRRKRFVDKLEVSNVVRERLQRMIVQGTFTGVHVFAGSADVPDDWQLRLVVLPLNAGHTKNGPSAALEAATTILRQRGEQPRVKQNRLIFLAADHDTVRRLRDQVMTMLAWQSIVTDAREGRLNLDMFMNRQAERSASEAQDAVNRTVREAYKWLLAPLQGVSPGRGPGEVEWDRLPLNTGAAHFAGEIDRVLKENAVLIWEWSPVHLVKELRAWFWKPEVQEIGAMDVWQKTCCYLYMPRLKDDQVFQRAIATGATSRDFFGIAYGVEKDSRYTGFSFGTNTTPILDNSLLLIEPQAAAQFENALQTTTSVASPAGTGATGTVREPQPPVPTSGTSTTTTTGATGTAGTGGAVGTVSGVSSPSERSFYGSVEVDAVNAKLRLAEIVDEVVALFLQRPGISVKIKLDIWADSETPFDEQSKRAVRENCKALNFEPKDFY